MTPDQVTRFAAGRPVIYLAPGDVIAMKPSQCAHCTTQGTQKYLIVSIDRLPREGDGAEAPCLFIINLVVPETEPQASVTPKGGTV